MKKIYIEPKVKVFSINAEAIMAVTSPGDTPGGDGLGNEPLSEYETGLSKEDAFGW